MSKVNVMFGNLDKPELWKRIHSFYGDVLQLKAEKMKPEKAKDLRELDKWFQTELPAVIASRKEKYITKAELCKVMKWKLTRGKFRPRLTQMVAENSEELVEESSKAAFKKLPDVIQAISSLTVLKAVGPATASAVLAAGCPTLAPFMADESMLAIPGLQPLAYTLSFYKSYVTEVNKIRKSLNKIDDAEDWTANKIQLTLWTYYLGEQLNPGMFSPTDKSGGENGKQAGKSGGENGKQAGKSGGENGKQAGKSGGENGKQAGKRIHDNTDTSSAKSNKQEKSVNLTGRCSVKRKRKS